ncbi:MAG: hypothetical protein ACHQ1D_06580 [Nitrososphaerales archaeon]|jgi:hypothetical protein
MPQKSGKNRANYKAVNTANYSNKVLENIASKKPELSIVGAAISKNGGTKKLVYK